MPSDIRTFPLNVAADTQDERARITGRLKASPIPDGELIRNLSLFTLPQDVKRLLFLNELYEAAMATHGVIMEFGVRWGRDLATFQSLRAVHEPFNYSRRIFGFDTFEGFASLDDKDGDDAIMQSGAFGVTDGYEGYLEDCLRSLEKESPVAEKKKFELVKGDVCRTIQEFMEARPELLICLAYFDMDIYRPTKACLEAILPRMPKGAVLAFDELCFPENPGETLALLESVDLRAVAVRRSRYSNYESYIVL